MKKTLFLSAILGAALCSSAFAQLTINVGAGEQVTKGAVDTEDGSASTINSLGELTITGRLYFDNNSTATFTATGESIKSTYSGDKVFWLQLQGDGNPATASLLAHEGKKATYNALNSDIAVYKNSTLTIGTGVTLNTRGIFYSSTDTNLNGKVQLATDAHVNLTRKSVFHDLVIGSNSSVANTAETLADTVTMAGSSSLSLNSSTIANLTVSGTQNTFSSSATSTITNLTLNAGSALTLSGTFMLNKALINNGTLTLAENAAIDIKNITATYIFDAYESQTDGFATGKDVYTVVSGNAAAYSQVVLKKNGAVQTGYTFDGKDFTSDNSKTTSRYMLVAEDSYTTTGLAATAPTATELSIGEGKTLEMDSTKWGLDKIMGAGNVTVSVATSLINSTSSAATGTLTVNGVQLSVGNGDAKTSSLSSFSNVVLDGGTIYYNNNHDTLNSVSVAKDKTGTIYSYDMGQNDATLTLKDTTTVDGTLNIWNRYNALFEIQNLAGSGTLNICGTDGGNTSDQNATYNLNLDNFTGTINVNSNKATVNRNFTSIAELLSAKTNFRVENGTVTNVSSGGLSEGTVNLGAISDKITGDITGGTINAGAGELTLTGTVSGGTINAGTGNLTITGKVSGGTINGGDTVTLSGQIAGGTIETATYKGNNLTGGTLNNVTLAANERLNVHDGSATLGNVAHATTGGSNGYAVVIYSNGQLTINGDADFTTNNYTKIGIDGNSGLIVDEGGQVVASDIYWSTNSHNGHVTVNNGGELNVTGEVHLKTLSNAGTVTIGSVTDMDKLTNSGSMTLNGANTSISSITLGGGTLTLGSEDEGEHNFNLTTSTLTVGGNSTLNANLVVRDGGTMDFSSSSVLTMGCTVSIGAEGGTVTVVLNADEIAAIQGGQQLVLIDGVDGGSLEEAITIKGTFQFRDAVGNSLDGLGLALQGVEYSTEHGAYAVVVTPEPATATLSLLALAGLAARRRRH